MVFERKKRMSVEICEKCGIENTGELTWKRSRSPLGERPLLCGDCARALSKALKTLIADWVEDK